MPVHVPRILPLLLAVGPAFVAASASGAEDFFDLITLSMSGRSVAAELADVDGDGRLDLFVVTLVGIPPAETRTIRVHLQKPGGGFSPEPDHVRAVPRWSAVYDVADVRPESPGAELILLRPEGLTILSLATGSAPRWDIRVPGPTTVGLATDERGLEPFRMAYPELGEEPWLLVPQVGQLTAVSPQGELRARLAIPRRANYLIIPATGLISLESDFQIFLDVPKLLLGDVNGDGRTDIASATRHEIQVFLRRDDGNFPREPDRSLALGLVTPRDHIRGSGGVASEARDIDGDGRLDLLISHVQGGFRDAATTISLYMNRDGGWRLGQPDQTMVSKASLSSSALADFDADGRMELIRVEFSFSLLEVIEILVTREIDVEVSLHRYSAEGGFEKKPWAKKKIGVPFSFETFRPKGFLPSAQADLNGDGYRDFVSSGGGNEFEFFPGGPDGPFAERPAKQKMRTAGVIHFADWSGDGLEDFLLFDPHNFDVPVRLGRNRGLLPGTAPASVGSPH
jgi:hypothetical protein